MKKYAALVAICLAGPVMAQEKIFDFDGITNIEVRNGITVNVVAGDEISVVGHAVSGDVDQFRLQQFGTWLAVNRNTRWFIFPYAREDDLVLTVTLPHTRALKAFDGSRITASGFSGGRLRAEALDGGTVALNNFDYEDLSLLATENGRLSISGHCTTLAVDAVGSGTVTAESLQCDFAQVEGPDDQITLPVETQIVETLPDPED